MGPISLEIKRVVRASPRRIYEAWVSADELKCWHCPEGMTIGDAQSDPRVGGQFRITMLDPDGTQHIAFGEYLELIPDSKVAFSWNWVDGKGTDTVVTVLLKSLTPDESEITLRHEGFFNQEPCDGHREGWTSALNRLQRHIELA
jgi:uncharacterized protein YndB with AHSA1/START domain